MTTATKKTKAKDPFDELAADHEQHRVVLQREYERFIVAIAERSDFDKARCRELLPVLGESLESLQKSVNDCRKRASLRAKVGDEHALKSLLAESKQAIVDAKAERERVIAPLDAKVAAAETAYRRKGDQYQASRDARDQLVKSAPEFLRDAIHVVTREIQTRERRNHRKLLPLRDEAVWTGNGYEPAGDTKAAQAKFDDWQRRKVEHDAAYAAEKKSIDRLKERRARMQELALEPLPTPEDLAALLELLDAEDERLAEAERAEAQATADEAETTAIEAM